MAEPRADLDQMLRIAKRSWRIWGALIACLVITIVIDVVRLIEHPGTTTVACVVQPHTDRLVSCVVVR